MNHNCPYCESEEPMSILDTVSNRNFTAQICCEQLQMDYDEVSDDQELLKIFVNQFTELEYVYDSPVDKILVEGIESGGHTNFKAVGLEGLMLSTKLRVEAISFKEMCIFVDEHHRHTKAPRGWKFGLGCYNGEELIGVASVGRPVARLLDDGITLEVNRVCVNPELHPTLVFNACSMLYSESAKRTKKLKIGKLKDEPQLDESGKIITYKKIITYTLETELGTSLKAVGWTIENVQKSGGSWSSKSRERKSLSGTDDIPKVRWYKSL